jgi:hypothetical protein
LLPLTLNYSLSYPRLTKFEKKEMHEHICETLFFQQYFVYSRNMVPIV